MPFFPIILLERLAATEIIPLVFLRSRMSATLNVASLGMWSITVPSSIADMFNSFFILLFPALMQAALFLPARHLLPAQNMPHVLFDLSFCPSHLLLEGDAVSSCHLLHFPAILYQVCSIPCIFGIPQDPESALSVFLSHIIYPAFCSLFADLIRGHILFSFRLTHQDKTAVSAMLGEL